MMNEELILDALGSAGDDLVEETRRALYGVPAAKKPAHAAGKLLLAAAIVISLLTVAAYAAGWFGLSSRLTPTEVTYSSEDNNRKEALRLSVNDYTGTPAAEASREWTEWSDQYVITHSLTNDTGFMDSLDETEKSCCMIYGAFDREMLDMLTQISMSNGVRLHTKIYAAPDYGKGLSALGIGDFIRGETGKSFKYIFEDGSFTVESYMKVGDTDVPFSLIRGTKGVLENGYFILDRAEIFDEWEYVTEAGVGVNIAVNRWNELTKTVPVFILCDVGDYLVTVQTQCPNEEDIRAGAEELAERFDYAALSGGKPDMSILEKKPEPVQPRPVKPKEGLMTVKEFFDTDEYKASIAFQRAFSDYYYTEVCKTESLVGTYMDSYYGAFPAKDENVNKLLADVLAEYPGLAVPGEALGVVSNCPIEADRIRSFCSYSGEGAPPAYVYEPAGMDEIFHMLGMEPFAQERLYTAAAFDTGAFWLSGLEWKCAVYYIPKGSFFPGLRFALDENGEAWAYETACGEQVSVALGGSYQKPVMAYNYALYETDTAYVFMEFPEELGVGGMQELLDGIDLTKLSDPKPWGDERKIVPKYIDYAPLTIMRSNFWCRDEYLIDAAERESSFFTYDALMGKDTAGITWELSGSDSVTLTDNGDGSCTLVSHGERREAVSLTAKRGGDSFTVTVVCENR